MGTSSTLDIRFQGQRVVRRAPYDGQAWQVMAALAASVASTGLEAVRVAFAKCEPLPRAAERKHPERHNIEDNRLFPQDRLDRYAAASEARGRAPFGLKRAVLSRLRCAFDHPYLGAACVFSDRLVDDEKSLGGGSADFFLDLDAGRAGMLVRDGDEHEALYLWVSMAPIEYDAPEDVYRALRAWFEQHQADILLAEKSVDPAGAVRVLQGKLDAFVLEPRSWPCSDAAEDNTWHLAHLKNDRTVRARWEALTSQPADIYTLYHPTDTTPTPIAVGFRKLETPDDEDALDMLEFLHAAARSLAVHAPVLELSRRHVEEDFSIPEWEGGAVPSQLILFDALHSGQKVAMAQAQRLATLGQGVLYRSPGVLLVETYAPGKLVRKGRDYDETLHGADAAVPAGGFARKDRSELLEDVRADPSVDDAVMALAVLDAGRWEANGADPDFLTQSLAYPHLRELMACFLVAMEETAAGSVATCLAAFDLATQQVLQERMGPALRAALLPLSRLEGVAQMAAT